MVFFWKTYPAVSTELNMKLLAIQLPEEGHLRRICLLERAKVNLHSCYLPITTANYEFCLDFFAEKCGCGLKFKSWKRIFTSGTKKGRQRTKGQ